MSKPNNTLPSVSPLFLVSLFDAAHKQGDATKAVVALLKSVKIKWSDDALVERLGVAFKTGHLAGALALNKAEAETIAALKPYNKDKPSSDERKTSEQDRAWRTATSAWSYASLRAGMPSKQTGKVRAPQMPGTREEPSSRDEGKSPDASQTLHTPVAKDVTDVSMFALHVADVLRKFENANAATKFGPYRSIFEAFILAVTTEINAQMTSPSA